MLAIEHRAVSLKPGPDVYLGSPARPQFLQDLLRTRSDVIIQASPLHPRHAGYLRRAECSRVRNRDRRIAEVSEATQAPARKESRINGDLCARASLSAFRTVSRSNLPWWAEQCDLVSEGCAAIIEAGAKDEALAVTVAHRAMVDYLRKLSVRQHERVWASGQDSEPDGLLDGERSYDVAPVGERRLIARRHTAKEPGLAGRNAALLDAIKALPKRQYQAIVLCNWAGCGCEEIAQQMGTTPKAVEGLLARARENLKEIIEHSG